MIDSTRSCERISLRPGLDPTPSEIREACLEIQQEWSASERRRRAGLPGRRGRTAQPAIMSVRVSLPNRFR